MKVVYILIALVVIAAASGCVNKQTETSTKAPVSPAQTQTSVSPAGTPAAPGSAVETDPFGTESELTSVDSLMSDSASMDISLSDSI